MEGEKKEATEETKSIEGTPRAALPWIRISSDPQAEAAPCIPSRLFGPRKGVLPRERKGVAVQN